jgi:hypothetical protein
VVVYFIRGSGTYIVKINIDSSKMVKHKVSNRIGSLDRVWVAVEGFEEPRVSRIVRTLSSGGGSTLNILSGNELA